MTLVDDGSCDGTGDLVAQMATEDPRLRLIRLSGNQGAAVARNIAIRAAEGRYIAFLDADDMWLPGKLTRQLAFMQAREAAFSFTGYERMDGAGAGLGLIGVPDQVQRRDLMKTCVIGCLTVIYDRHMLGRVEMPLLRKRQDFGLWLRLLTKTPVAHGLNEVLARYRVASGSLSTRKAGVAGYNWRLYRQELGLTRPQAAYYFSHYAVRGALRYHAPGMARRLGLLHVPKDAPQNPGLARAS
ncbi:UNVERIFIED_CONTAM: hypothetical protein GTU68_055610 [Idotea baltica]|nr:hypothetical protein [Idotea baltica]